jgi:SAM-dependent methyltransferase
MSSDRKKLHLDTRSLDTRYLDAKSDSKDLFIHFEHRLMYRYMPAFFFGIAKVWCRRLYRMAEQDIFDLYRGGSVLEVGPGNGNLLERLLKREPNFDYTGLDISSDLVEFMREKFSGTSAGFVEGDVCELPFEDSTFNLVIATGTICHWRDPDLGLREIERVLKPGGSLYIQDQLGYSGLINATRAVAQGFMGFGLSWMAENEMVGLYNNCPLKLKEYKPEGQLFRAWLEKPKK